MRKKMYIKTLKLKKKKEKNILTPQERARDRRINLKNNYRLVVLKKNKKLIKDSVKIMSKKPNNKPIPVSSKDTKKIVAPVDGKLRRKKEDTKEKKKRSIGWLIVKFIYILTLIIIVVAIITNLDNIMLRKEIKGLKSQEDLNAFCAQEQYDCYISYYTDYTYEGYDIFKVRFISDAKYAELEGDATSTEEESTATSTKKIQIFVQKAS